MKNDYYALDRFEGDYAIIQNWRTYDLYDIPKADLPNDAREGITLKINNGKYIVDYEKHHSITQEMQEAIKQTVVKSSDLYTVTKLEETYAVCKNEQTNVVFNFPYTNINGQIKERDTLKLKNGSYSKINLF